MGRKSRSDRISEVLRNNPSLNREDPRIGELLASEDLLRRAQRAASKAPITVTTANGGTKRSPEYVAVDRLENTLRRLRNELGQDRLSIKRSEAAGIKIKRSPRAQHILDHCAHDYPDHADLMPGSAALWAAYGIVAEDLPEEYQEQFRNDLAEYADEIQPIRDRLRQHGML